MKPIFRSTLRSRRSRPQQHQSAQPETQDAFFQPKLTINEPGDSYEREADAVADTVVNNTGQGQPAVQRMPISSVQRLATPDEEKMPATNDARMAEDKKIQEKPEEGRGPGAKGGGMVQKMDAPKEEEKPVQKMDAPKEEEKPVQKAAEEEETPVQGKEEEEKPVQKMDAPKEEEKPVQKMDAPKEEEKPVQKAAEEEEPVQAKEEEEEPVQAKSQAGAPQASPNFSARLSARKGRGEPLPVGARAQMERGIGADFGQVRIHTDSEAVDMNKEIRAQAFTHGQDVYFNSGKFSPESAEGKRLLAHELTHVVQQGAVRRTMDTDKIGRSGVAIRRQDDKKKEEKPKTPDFEAIKKFIDQIATGKEALARKDEYKVSVEFIAGGGSYYDPSTNKMIIDSNESVENAGLTFVHEMNHAYYQNKGLAADIKKLTKEEYVKGRVEEEAEGTVKSIEAKMEFEAAKIDTKGATFPLEKEYKEAYQKVKDDAAKKEGADKPKAEDVENKARDAGKKRVIKGFMDGEVVTSNTNETYPDYYKKDWDNNHKDDAKNGK